MKDLHINIFLMIAFICVIGLIGVNSIGFIDMNVYQQFWGAFFIEGVKMEKKYPFLIKLGDASVFLDTIKTRINANRNFYVFVNFLLMVTWLFALLSIFKSVYIKLMIVFLWSFTFLLIVKAITTVARNFRFKLTLLYKSHEIQNK